MDAPNEVTRLIAGEHRHLFSNPTRNRVIDPSNGPRFVDQEHTHIDQVENRLQIGSLFGQRLFGLRAVDDFRLEQRVGGLQLFGALVDQLLEVIAMLQELRFDVLALGDIDTHFQDEGGAVKVGEGKVGDVVVAAIRAGPLPLKGCHGL